MKVGETLNLHVDYELHKVLYEIGQVTGEHPADVAMTILRAGTAARAQAMIEEAEAEQRHLEAELTAVQARLMGLNGSSKAPVRPVQPSPAIKGTFSALTLPAACDAVLGSDRARTWKTREVMAQLMEMGYSTTHGNLFRDVNRALHALVNQGRARNPARGEFTWRQRRAKSTQG